MHTTRSAAGVEFLDLTGRVVARQMLFPGFTARYFTIQFLPAGMYLMRVSGGCPVRVAVE